mgnify:FL=1
MKKIEKDFCVIFTTFYWNFTSSNKKIEILIVCLIATLDIGMSNVLNVKVMYEDSDIRQYYERVAASNHVDSGIDLPVLEDIIIPDPGAYCKVAIDFGIRCEPLFAGGYYLVPRSSIHKTKFRMANSIGLIDNTYRGNIIAQLDYFPEITTTSMNPHVIQKGTKLFQLVHPSTLPLTIRLVDEVGNTERGTGAFGSTGM